MIVIGIIAYLVGLAVAQDYVCGLSRLDVSSSRVIGGTDSIEGLIPWMLRLEGFDDLTEETRLVCGAVLIDPWYALTSARCLEQTSDELQVVAGSLGEEVSGYEQYLDIQDTYVHPEFDNSSSNYPNDIAIIEFVEPANISESAGPVYPICLPPTNDTVYWENPSCVMTGYGISEANSSVEAETLQQAWVDVIREVQCELWWREDDFLLPTHQCAMDQIDRSVSLCHGDLGSPLSCMVDGRSDLAGVASFYDVDCSTNIPAVYTSTGHYLDWIVDITGVMPREE